MLNVPDSIGFDYAPLQVAAGEAKNCAAAQILGPQGMRLLRNSGLSEVTPMDDVEQEAGMLIECVN
jgi:hypothetical protein